MACCRQAAEAEVPELKEAFIMLRRSSALLLVLGLITLASACSDDATTTPKPDTAASDQSTGDTGNLGDGAEIGRAHV